MLFCQDALLHHIGVEFTSPTVKTLKPYAGEIREPATLTQLVPSVFSVYTDGLPVSENPEHRFDLVCVTESRVLNKETSKNANLQLSTDICQYLKDKPIFTRQGGTGKGTYHVDPEQTQARIGSITDRHAIVIISLVIFDRTH